MKRALIVRHANWNNQVDELTLEGRDHAAALAAKLPKFAAVYASPTNRTRQTAAILSEQDPIVNPVFAPPAIASDLRDAFLQARNSHPLGAAGAVIVVPEVRAAFRRQAEQAIAIFREILAAQPGDALVLIVSHDGVMVAIEKFIAGAAFDTADHTFGELQGFVAELQPDGQFGIKSADVPT